MVSTILGLIIGIAIGAALGNDNIRHKILAQLNKATAEKPHKEVVKNGAKSTNSKCKYCDNGVQINKDGLKVECPVCHGNG